MARSANLLVIYNSASKEAVKYLHYLKPYLEHFRFPYDEIDLAKSQDLDRIRDCGCVLLSHPELGLNDRSLEEAICQAAKQALSAGVGVIFFDMGLYHVFTGHHGWSFKGTVQTRHLTFQPHFITKFHGQTERLKLFGKMHIVPIAFPENEILIHSDGLALLAARQTGEGRIAVWTSMDWVSTFILGPLGGLDDCFWRSVVWTARKPFAMAGLPPIVTMRVDDVAGTGGRWKRSPLYWVQTANRFGFKPWLGLFIYNLTDDAIAELRGLISGGKATAFPHAFGRPPRQADSDFYYHPAALPLRSDAYDEFIYFDHQKGTPWTDDEAKKGLAAVDLWYAEHKPLPMSRYAVCHWYEAGNNTLGHMADRWGVRFIAQVKDPEAVFNEETPWLKAGPFRLFEQPGSCAANVAQRGERPVYYADFITVGEKKFFNCVTEIRDDAGYEWKPGNDVDETVGRGVRQLCRALDSKALAMLFTHETDYVWNIEPQNWEKEMERIAEGVASRHPVFMTADDAILAVMSHCTSKFVSSRVDDNGRISVEFSGETGAPTGLSIFEDHGGEMAERQFKIPVFKGSFTTAV